MRLVGVLVAVVGWQLADVAVCQELDTGRGRSCVGGHRHGSLVHLTLYWYMCNNGVLEPRGCFAPNRNKLEMGQTYVADGVRLSCEMDESSAGVVRLRYVGCEVAGELHGPHEFWNDPRTSLWYYCEQLGAALRLNFGGCVVDGERIGKGTQTVRQGVIYACESAAPNRPAGLRPVGCMHYAKRYNLGNSFQDSEFWYMCSASADGRAAVRKPMGCIRDGQRVELGERWTIEQNIIVECQTDNLGKLQLAPVGCMTDHGAKDVGESWSVGYPPYRYTMTCLLTNNGGSTEATPTGCAFVDSQMVEVPIAVGCYEIIDEQAVACKRRPSDGKIMYTIFAAGRANYAHAFGVRLCDGDNNEQ